MTVTTPTQEAERLAKKLQGPFHELSRRDLDQAAALLRAQPPQAVDDQALIAEAERLAHDTFDGRTYDQIFAATLLRLTREGWQPPAPEPDRAEVLAKELWEKGSFPSLKDWEAIIRRHFDELGAEWEAERPVIDVPEEVIEAAKAVRAGFLRSSLADYILSLIDGAGVRAILRVAGEKM